MGQVEYGRLKGAPYITDIYIFIYVCMYIQIDRYLMDDSGGHELQPVDMKNRSRAM
jgi:hypothetical protein